MTDTTLTAPRIGASLAIGALAGAFFAALSLITPVAPLMVVAAAAIAIGLVAAIDHPEVGLVMLMGAAALDHVGRIAQFGPLKLTLYQALVAYMAIILVARVVDGRSRLTATPIDLPVLLFLGTVAASLLVAGDLSVAIVATVSLASSAFLAYAVVMLADTPRRLSVLVLGTLAVGAVIGVLGAVERAEIYAVVGYLPIWGEGVRAKVTFADPNIMGSFQLTAAALALPLVLMARDWRAKVVGSVGVLATVAGMLSTGSRGATVGFAIALLMILALSRIRFSAKVALVLIVVVLAGIWFVFVADPVWLQNRVINVADDGSMLARVYMGASALEIHADNPGGVGIGNYTAHYPFYRDASVRFNLIESHTAYLTILVETGLLGLLAFLAILAAATISTARALWTARDPIVHALAVGALAAIVGIAAQAFTYSLENSKFWWLSIGVGLATWVMVRADTHGTNPTTMTDGAMT